MLANKAVDGVLNSDRRVVLPSMRAAYSVLFVSTLAFMVCFAVWTMFGVIGVPIRRQLGLNNTEFGLLTSTPVLLGALMRLPLGMWTDRVGGRPVFATLLLVTPVPVFLVSYARALWQFLALGLLLGVVGASFAVGTPYVAPAGSGAVHCRHALAVPDAHLSRAHDLSDLSLHAARAHLEWLCRGRLPVPPVPDCAHPQADWMR